MRCLRKTHELEIYSLSRRICTLNYNYIIKGTPILKIWPTQVCFIYSEFFAGEETWNGGGGMVQANCHHPFTTYTFKRQILKIAIKVIVYSVPPSRLVPCPTKRGFFFYLFVVVAFLCLLEYFLAYITDFI